MFQLRKAHLDAFDVVVRAEFYSRLAERFRRSAPTIVSRWDGCDLEETIAKAQEHGRASGLRTYHDLAQWSLLSLIAGLEFYQIPCVALFLAERAGAMDEALTELIDRFSQTVRQTKQHRQAAEVRS